ncbi:MAG TPA: cell division protein CrgA [Nocardioides sp.]
MSKSQSDPESTSEASTDEATASAAKKPATSTSATAAKSEKSEKSEKSAGAATATKGGALGRLRRERDPLAAPRQSLLTPRFILMVVLIVVGIAWITMTWRALGASSYDEWAFIPEEERTRRWVWELGLWNYAIGFGAILVGLIVGAHRSTPLGRGNGVVVGMLACFGVGLIWICTFYLFADDISSIWVFGALGQWNLVVGIAFMAVGFSYATKWE